MRRLVATVMVGLVSGGLTGCVGGGDPTPSPSPVVTPSPVETPSPTWTDEQQAAIDAARRFLAVSAEIGGHLADGNWDRIREVAGDPTANNTLLIYVEWQKKGWHMEGAPDFEPDYVNRGMMDDIGDRFWVHGCMDVSNSFVVDQDGNHVGERGSDRGPFMFVVLRVASDGRYVVLENTWEDKGTC